MLPSSSVMKDQHLLLLSMRHVTSWSRWLRGALRFVRKGPPAPLVFVRKVPRTPKELSSGCPRVNPAKFFNLDNPLQARIQEVGKWGDRPPPSPPHLDLQQSLQKKYSSIMTSHTRMMCYLGNIPFYIIASKQVFFSFKPVPW